MILLLDTNDLLKAIKTAALDVINSTKPMTVTYGLVTKETPLEIKLEQKFNLSEKQLILSRNVTDYTTLMTIGSGRQIATIHNKLKEGERVILLREPGGEKYLVHDRIGDA